MKILNFEFCLKLKTETEPQNCGFRGLTVWIFTKRFRGSVQVSRFLNGSVSNRFSLDTLELNQTELLPIVSSNQQA